MFSRCYFTDVCHGHGNREEKKASIFWPKVIWALQQWMQWNYWALQRSGVTMFYRFFLGCVGYIDCWCFFSFFLWTVFFVLVFLVDCCFLFITVTRWKVHLKSWCFCPNCTQDLCTIVSKERSHGLTCHCPTLQVATVVCLNDVCRGNKSLKMKTFLSPQAASAPWASFMLFLPT